MRKWKMTHHYTILFFTRYLIGMIVIALALMMAPVYAVGGNSGHHGGSVMKGGKGGAAGKKGKSTAAETVSASPAAEVSVASSADEVTESGHGGKSDKSGQGGKGKGKGKGSGKENSDSNDVASSSSGSSSEAKGRGNSGGGKSGGQGSDGKGKNSDSWSGGGNHSDVVKDSTTEDDDSDRPAWAGKDGDHDLKPGGGNNGSDTKKGGDYGDLFAMSRADDGTLLEYHEDGTPCGDGEGDCYPAALLFDEDGNLIEDEVFVLSPDAEAPDNVEGVELGRLNISRAPDKVLEHALSEALSKLDPDMDGYLIDLTNWMTLTDTAGRLLAPDTLVAIDSPLENLAIFQALLAGYVPLSEENVTIDGVTITSGDFSITVAAEVLPQIAAAALAGASDKHDIMDIDEVSYLGKFLEIEDKLNSLVEDYDDWYTPGAIYNVDMTVLAVDDTTDPPSTSWVEVNLLDPDLDLFNDIRDIDVDGNGIDVFTQSVDDALQVIEFIHDNVVL